MQGWNGLVMQTSFNAGMSQPASHPINYAQHLVPLYYAHHLQGFLGRALVNLCRLRRGWLCTSEGYLVAVITTFSVGEISAINAIAGSYSEFVPVVHIVGMPSTSSQSDRRVLHHSLGDGNFKAFADIYKAVTVAQADLLDPVAAPREIDRVLRTCWIKSRPVYIQVPTDMVHKMVDGTALKERINLSAPLDKDVEANVVSRILAELYVSKRPFILVDGFGFRPQVRLYI